MQTIIQHVIRGYGPPVAIPVEFGIHYIDIQTGDLYISRGKTSAGDWGQPLKAAMVEGEEGKTFGWNDGQDWIVLNIGVQPAVVDDEDNAITTQTQEHAATTVTSLGALSQAISAQTGDSNATQTIQTYIESQLGLVAGTPGGGDPSTVLAKLSDADRDAFWLTVQEGEVLQTVVDDGITNVVNFSETTTSTLRAIPDSLNIAGYHLVGNNEWNIGSQAVTEPSIIWPKTNQMVPPEFTIVCSGAQTVYGDPSEVHRRVTITQGIHQIVYETKTNHVRVKCYPEMPALIEITDVSFLGDSRTAAVTVEVSNIIMGAVLATEAVNNIIRLPSTFSVQYNVVNGVDDITSVDWQILFDGNVVISQVSNSQMITLTTGSLDFNKPYVVRVRIQGKLFGWTDWVSETFSVDGVKLLATGRSGTLPRLQVFAQTGDDFDSIFASNPSVGNVYSNALCWSNDGSHLAVAHSTSPYWTIHKRNGLSVSKLLDLPGSVSTWLAAARYSPTNDHLFITGQQSHLYSRTGDVYVKLTSGVPYDSYTVRDAEYSPDGQFLAMASGGSIGALRVWKKNQDNTYTKITTTPTTGGDAYTVSWDPTSKYVVVACYDSPKVMIFRRGEFDTFNSGFYPPDLLTAIGGGGSNSRGAAFSPDGKWLVVTQPKTGYGLVVWKRVSDEGFELMTLDPTLRNPSYGTKVLFSPDSKYLMTSRNLLKIEGDEFVEIPSDSIPKNGAWWYE